MKTQNKISLGLAIIFAAGSLTFTSCRKKEEKPDQEEDTEQSTATDNNMAESAVNDIVSIGSEISENGSLDSYRPGSTGSTSSDAGIASAACATVSGLGTKIITVDFGSGCVGQDGRIRAGKLIFNFTASTPTTAIFYRNPGFSMNITSQNYVVDGYQVNILNKTVTNITTSSLPPGKNPGTNLTWAVTANVSIVKPNAGGTVSWSCARTQELMNTSDTNCYRGQGQHIIWQKAIIRVNGNANGTNAKGETYSAVAQSLVKDFNCAPDPQRPRRHPFISGTVSYTPGNRPMRLINFGTGACDFNATVTINGNVYNIVLN